MEYVRSTWLPMNVYMSAHMCIQDPLKEKETEMMMDYIERFNEVIC